MVPWLVSTPLSLLSCFCFPVHKSHKLSPCVNRYTVVWGFTMGLGTMNMCFSAFANAKAAIHRINEILDEPIQIVGALAQ